MDDVSEKFTTIGREEVDWTELRPMDVHIDQDSFTQDEIDGLIAFYRTPAGNALVEKMPAVMQRSMGQPMIAPMMQRMKAATNVAAAEGRKAK